jgi:inosine-uridine nucleoside N-ribohydrolase
MLKNNNHCGVILDTDIGYDADDFFALLLLLNSPELSLDLIITGDETEGKRARLTRKILEVAGRSEIKVVTGADLGNVNFSVEDMISDTPKAELDTLDVVEEIRNIVNQYDKVIYIGIQGFSNLATFIRRYPNLKEKLKVFQMGCSLDYSRFEGWVEHNVRIDIPAARFVFESGVDITLVMAQTTMEPGYCFNEENQVMIKLRASDNLLHKMLLESVVRFQEKLKLKGVSNPWPYAHDPLTVSVALGNNFVQFEDMLVSMNESGELMRDPNGKKVRGSLKNSDSAGFMEFLGNRLFGNNIIK